ncbi:FTR1 family protein [[Clostridium] ultunense Esp]|nr:FTR1 family protein [[Clostridium] ultunense Esp]
MEGIARRKMGGRKRLSFLLLLFFLVPAYAFAFTPADDLKGANQSLIQAREKIEKGEVAAAKQAYEDFTQMWKKIEDGIKEASKKAYGDIEDSMGMVQFVFSQDPPNKEKILSALDQLLKVNQDFIDGKYPAEDSGASSGKQDGNELIALLDQSLTRLKEGDVKGAAQSIRQFRGMWLDIEGIILTQSQKAYQDAERDMVLSYAYLTSTPPDVEKGKEVISNMREYLAPLLAKNQYTFFDAVSILLREGLEALLVIVALLAFLDKSGHGEKKGWVWGGVGAGLGGSLFLGILVQILFTSGAFGTNNFLIAGWTGLFAAAMLLYMTYWLHNKASIENWRKYIKTKSEKALATGSLLSLAVLSFLAVFREGTETVLFFIGMASSISLSQLLGGIAFGIILLIILGILILKVGMRIPLRPFFLLSSLLVFYLSLKFTGMGIKSLQLAGLLPATHVEWFPTIEFFSIYPTAEGLILQAALLVVVLFFAVWERYRAFSYRRKMEAN